MLWLSLEMFWKEKKKALNLGSVIATVLLINIVLLQFFENPFINYKLNTFAGTQEEIDYLQVLEFFDGMFKGSIVLIVIIVCFSLVIYSCNYYNKIHSKIIGLLKINGYSNSDVVKYQMIQIVIITIIAYITALVASLIIIPVCQWCAYRYMSIDESIFYYSKMAYGASIMIVIFLLVYIAMMQANYSIRTIIPDLLKRNDVSSFKIKHVMLSGSGYVYLGCYILGICTLYYSELNQGIVIPACICAIGSYGLAKSWIPKVLKEKMNKLSIDAKKNLIISNYILNIQQLKSMFLMFMITTIVLGTMVCTNYKDSRYLVMFQVAFIITNITLSITMVNRFSINRYNKRYYYLNLNKIGLNKDEIIKISRIEVLLTYLTIFSLGNGYLVNLVIRFTSINEISITLGILVLLEFSVPLVIAYLITIYKEKAGIKYGNNY